MDASSIRFPKSDGQSMTETNDSIAAVGDLIQERRKYESWLAALEARERQTPQHVYERVKADYESRLRQAIESIGAHADALTDREQALSARLSEIGAMEQRRRDERAEAELRAHVGEINAETWDATAGEIDAALASMSEERSAIERDIADVREMLAAAQPAQAAPLGSGTRPAAEPPTPQPGTRAADQRGNAPASPPDEMEIPIAGAGIRGTPAGHAAIDDRKRDAGGGAEGQGSPASHPQLELPTGEHPAQSPLAPDAPGSVPERGAERGPFPRRDSFDELAFLKTVTGITPPDATRAPAAPSRPADQRASGGSAPATGGMVASPRAPVRPPTEGRSSGATDQNDESALRGVEPKAVKTLQCAACKTMNLPTEWYCEHCGAELAAL
jgi:hypothetical protein